MTRPLFKKKQAIKFSRIPNAIKRNEMFRIKGLNLLLRMQRQK
jgi:hypothetical protein